MKPTAAISSNASASSPGRTCTRAYRAANPHAARAAFCMGGDAECATGSPKIASRIG